MKYIIIIAITLILGSISVVQKMSEPDVQASIPTEYIDFITPMVFEVSNTTDPAVLYRPSAASDAGVDGGFIACP